MQRFEIGKSTVTIDQHQQVVVFEHSDSITERKSENPWIVPFGAIESIDFTPKTFLEKPRLRLFLHDRAGYNPGIGADLNTVTGGKNDEPALAQLRDVIEAARRGAGGVVAGPVRKQPYRGQVVAPVGAVKFGDLILDGSTIYCAGEAVALGRARAEILDADAARSRVTATRVVAGAVLAGPVGALIGGMAKKSTGRVYVVVTCDDGRILSGDAPSKAMGSASELVTKINMAAN